METTNQK